MLIATIALFLTFNLGAGWEYALGKRSIKVAAMILVAFAVAYSSVVFQTLTQNKILTPSIMGFEPVYLLFQTAIVFLYGDKTFKVLNNEHNFLISVACMMLFAIALYYLVFKKEKSNMYFLLLVGLVLGTVFTTISSFLQMLIDPNEFLIIEGKMFATFNKINTDLLWISGGVLLLVFLIGSRMLKYLDVLSLGKTQAINLGVHYHQISGTFLLMIAALVAVSTALVGPITFLGILVSNLTYELFRTYRHSILITACCLISAVAVIGGQFIVEHFF